MLSQVTDQQDATKTFPSLTSNSQLPSQFSFRVRSCRVHPPATFRNFSYPL